MLWVTFNFVVNFKLYMFFNINTTGSQVINQNILSATVFLKPNITIYYFFLLDLLLNIYIKFDVHSSVHPCVRMSRLKTKVNNSTTS